jgi:hypothetical protein
VVPRAGFEPSFGGSERVRPAPKGLKTHDVASRLPVARLTVASAGVKWSPSGNTSTTTANGSRASRNWLNPLPSGSLQKAAMNEIAQNIQERLGVRLQQWNNQPANAPIRTPVIEPTLTEMKFVSGAKRVCFGAMAGSSMPARSRDPEGGSPGRRFSVGTRAMPRGSRLPLRAPVA